MGGRNRTPNIPGPPPELRAGDARANEQTWGLSSWRVRQ